MSDQQADKSANVPRPESPNRRKQARPRPSTGPNFEDPTLPSTRYRIGECPKLPPNYWPIGGRRLLTAKRSKAPEKPEAQPNNPPSARPEEKDDIKK